MVADVVIYGATMAGIAAAVQVRRMGRSVILISETPHLGGITTAGLGFTDGRWPSAIGGIAREFYRALWHYYWLPSSWGSPQARDDFRDRVWSQLGRSLDDDARVAWTFEPKAAQKVVTDWLSTNAVQVRVGRLARDGGVARSNDRITSLSTEEGGIYSGPVFIDATYEGDLLAAAGVPYRVGRESASDFGESLAGVSFSWVPSLTGVSPFVVPGDPASGYLWGIDGTLVGEPAGARDEVRMQPFCFRLCLTNGPNRLEIAPPDGYDPRRYELLFRYYEQGNRSEPWSLATTVPNGKIDANSAGPMGFDYLGGNRTDRGVRWVDASYDERRAIFEEHRRYQLGYLWALRNEPRIPEDVRGLAASWSLASDEFRESGGWPPQLYVREGRRLVGATTVTQHHAEGAVVVPDPVALASYPLDCHPIRRVVVRGRIGIEGAFFREIPQPWPISYRSMVAADSHTTNLVVPVALSATHVAYGSLRMEPTFMALGQAAGTAAVIAVESGVAVQGVDYRALAARLRADRQRVGAADLAVPSSV